MLLSAENSVAADGITFADVHNCAKVVGDFANVIPVVHMGGTALKAIGVLPDEEKEFRERIEAQNKKILDGISSLSSGIQRIESSLEEIQKELAALRSDVKAIPERTRGSDLYMEAYTLLKRVTRLENPSASEMDRINIELQEVIDQAEAASTLSPAELHYYSGVSLLSMAIGRSYQMDVLTSGKNGLSSKQRAFYEQSAQATDRLLEHCESTFDLLANRKELRETYDSKVETLISTCRSKA